MERTLKQIYYLTNLSKKSFTLAYSLLNKLRRAAREVGVIPIFINYVRIFTILALIYRNEGRIFYIRKFEISSYIGYNKKK
ncbi:hypothetical protein YWH7199_02425 [Fusobacterium nucleatum YWH7199]|nr:hypothetical protein [Fusobacterium nucleatum YWH7199]